MKEIMQADIEIVKTELSVKRDEFEKLGLTELEDRLKWIQKFFDEYVPELERRYMSEEEIESWEFLPNKLRIYFYVYFPEHGLNMANLSQELAYKLAQERANKPFVNRWLFSHHD